MTPRRRAPQVMLLLAVLWLGAHARSAHAGGKLIDLIPGLYGGDGISLATDPGADHTAHFSIDTATNFNRLNDQIAAEVGGFPFSSSVDDFNFTFDAALGTFVSATTSLGPLFAEQAATLGQGNLNVGVSYTTFKYHTFNGERLSRFQVRAEHDTDTIGLPDIPEQFEADTVLITVDLDIRVHIVALAATYGLTERLDIGLLLPIVHVDMEVESLAQVEVASDNTLFPGVHTFEDGPESAADRASGKATGLGDMVWRAKYHVFNGETLDVAAALLTKLATGDEEDFLGTGDHTLRPFAVLSKSLSIESLPTLSLTSHLNLGYEWNLNRPDQNSLEYVAGIDVGTPRLTFVAELLGSHELDGDGIGDDILTASFGMKWNPWKRYLLSANAQLPLNDDGLRSNFVLTFGAKASF